MAETLDDLIHRLEGDVEDAVVAKREAEEARQAQQLANAAKRLEDMAAHAASVTTRTDLVAQTTAAELIRPTIENGFSSREVILRAPEGTLYRAKCTWVNRYKAKDEPRTPAIEVLLGACASCGHERTMPVRDAASHLAALHVVRQHQETGAYPATVGYHHGGCPTLAATDAGSDAGEPTTPQAQAAPRGLWARLRSR